MNDLRLVFVNFVCENPDGLFEYDLYFSNTPEIVWGVDWDYDNPSICGDLTPDESTYSEIIRIESPLKLKTIQEISCYSLEYATYDMIALSWIDIDQLEHYPEKGRMVFHFGETKLKILEELERNGIEIIEE